VRLSSIAPPADGSGSIPGPSTCAGGVEKRGSLGALQAEGLRRGEEVVFADEIKKLCL